MYVFVSIAVLLLITTTLASIIKGAPFVPSDQKNLSIMIKLAKVKKGDVAADLGSGDGRVVIALAKSGAIAHGYEINPLLVLWSLINIRRLGLQDKAHIHLKSFWRINLNEFDIITIFGISYIMTELQEKITKEVKKDCHIVSHSYEFSNWKETTSEQAVYLYSKDRKPRL